MGRWARGEFGRGFGLDLRRPLLGFEFALLTAGDGGGVGMQPGGSPARTNHTVFLVVGWGLLLNHVA